MEGEQASFMVKDKWKLSFARELFESILYKGKAKSERAREREKIYERPERGSTEEKDENENVPTGEGGGKYDCCIAHRNFLYTQTVYIRIHIDWDFSNYFCPL